MCTPRPSGIASPRTLDIEELIITEEALEELLRVGTELGSGCRLS